MKHRHACSSSIPIVLATFATVMGFTSLTWGQRAPSWGGQTPNQSTPTPGGVSSDWSHHHVVFSQPGTAEEARRNGTYDSWLTIANDPRFAMQQRKRNGARPALLAPPESAAGDLERACVPELPGEPDTTDARAGMTEGDFPGGMLPRGLAHALVPPPVERPEPLPEFSSAGDCHRAAKNRFHKDWSETEGNNGTTGLGNYPATFTSTSASCATDFALYNTGLAGSGSQASLIAYNQLYSSCTSGPSVYWAYNTGGTIATSVVLSADGTQVAFVQSNSGVASLVVLKWVSGGTPNYNMPTTVTSNSSYPNCTAPCMISIPFSGSPSDTYSSPFIAYGANVIYVGDDAGNLHKFTNIFSASTPAEATSPWPVTLNPSTDAALGSPVYDSVSGNVFVGDYLANIASGCQPGIHTAAGQCGYLYSVNAGSGAVTRSAQLDYNLGIYDGPLVDSSAGTVYAFVGDDGSSNCSSGPCAAVFQFPVNFSGSATGTEATVGAGYEFLMSGNFDNQYFTSSNAMSPTGHLYVVGGTGPQNNTLYAITITNNAMTAGSATAGPVVATNYTNSYYAAGLPVTEFCNNGSNECTASQGTDYLFLGVLSFGSSFSSNPCTAQSLTVGCVMGFTIPASGVIASSATPNGTLTESGGTSGIVVDNGASGASNIYFSTLGNQTCGSGTGGCSVSATQAALD
jgi:hypothetical protein